MRKSKTQLFSMLFLVLVLVLYFIYFAKTFKVPQNFEKLKSQTQTTLSLISEDNIKETYAVEKNTRRHSRFHSKKSHIETKDGVYFFENHQDLVGFVQIKCFFDPKTQKPQQHLYVFNAPDGIFDFSKSTLATTYSHFTLYLAEGHRLPFLLPTHFFFKGTSKDVVFQLNNPMQFNAKRLQMTIKKKETD
ncbi:MAG: hypothetical protein K940chlam8_00136 [Chlamydiae bacterium]|nr:hypothetical protein [Chlamydiota bacterium]